MFVVKCTAGIDFIPADVLTMDPQETRNITFDIHSFYSIGQINQCQGTCTLYIQCISHRYVCMYIYCQ